MSELYQLPDGWEWKLLGDVTKFKQGSQIPIKEQSTDYMDGYDRFIRIVDYTQNTDDIRYIKHNSKNTFVTSDEVIMVRYGNVGFVGRGIDGVLANNMFKVIPNSDELTNDYLYKYLNSNIVQNIVQSNNSSTMSAINFKLVSSIPFVLPPLSEQKRIVSKLDLLFEKIDKSIALHQKNMDEADVFMGSVLNDVFGELEEKYGLNILSDSVETPKKDIVDGPFGSNLKATEYIDSGIPIIRLQNIQRFKFIDKDIKFVSEEKAQQLQRHTFKSGDVVITKLGDPLGKSCIVPNFLDNGIIVADVIRVRVDKSKSITKYINYSINSSISINQFSDSSKGATRQRVKLTMVRDLKIPLPPLNIQQKVVKYLDEISEKIEKVKSVQKEKMDSLKALKASILDKAFKGEL